MHVNFRCRNNRTMFSSSLATNPKVVALPGSRLCKALPTSVCCPTIFSVGTPMNKIVHAGVTAICLKVKHVLWKPPKPNSNLCGCPSALGGCLNYLVQVSARIPCNLLNRKQWYWHRVQSWAQTTHCVIVSRANLSLTSLAEVLHCDIQPAPLLAVHSYIAHLFTPWGDYTGRNFHQSL